MTNTDLYRSHLDVLNGYLEESLKLAEKHDLGLNGVLFHAGRARAYHSDDQEIVFHSAPHFSRWVPLSGPEHVVLARPGRQPLVVRVVPKDYWYDTSPPPASYWEDAVEVKEVDSFSEITQATGELQGIAYVGDAPEAAAEVGIPVNLVEPEELMAPLDWYRAYKTEHEIALMEVAAQRGSGGHLAAREAFDKGASEREIHWAYVQGTGQLERELPFETIIALDEKSAILHYQHKRGGEAAPGKNLLVDAGGSCQGYHSDITRTWPRAEAPSEFRALAEALDTLERELVAMVAPGVPYLRIHVAAYRGIAEILSEAGIFRSGAEEAGERGLVGAFFPHGVGHHLGLQVHDIAGRQAGPEGGTVNPPTEHPFLRNTRTLEAGHVVTIEPGLYFIPLLLAPLRSGSTARLVDWNLVDRLTPLGGIRIEDDVLCTEEGHRDLTRGLCPGLQGA